MTAEPIEPDPPRLHVVPDQEDRPTAGHFDVEAEKIILGAMLLAPDVIDDVAEVLAAGHFYRVLHGTIYTAILTQRAKDEPTDPVAIGHVLATSGDLARIGGAPYLHTLIASVPTAANAAWYAGVIAEHARWRDLGRAGTRISQIAAQRGVDLSEARNRVQTVVHEATTSGIKSDYRRWRDLVGPAMDRIEAAAETTGPIGLPTGLVDLDKMLAGLRDGQLIVVAGRPGMGKSIFGVDVARHTAMKLGKTAAIFSLEMSEPELTNRILSAETAIPLRNIETGDLTDRDWTQLARRVGEVEEAPLIIDDSATLNLAEIRAKARRLKQRHDLRLVVVDYLQLMTTPGKSESRQLEVGELSRGLKLLGKEIGCPIMALSQLNRSAESRADRRPQISDLRESGSIEQDADIVILLHRDSYYDKNKRPGEVDVIVGKNRNGPMGAIVACAQLHLTRIVDFAAPVQ